MCVRDFVRTLGAGVAGRLHLIYEGPDKRTSRSVIFPSFNALAKDRSGQSP